MSRSNFAVSPIVFVFALVLLTTIAFASALAAAPTTGSLAALFGKDLDGWEKILGKPAFIDRHPQTEHQMGEVRYYKYAKITDLKRVAVMRGLQFKTKRVDAVEFQFAAGTQWKDALQRIGVATEGVTVRTNEDGNLEIIGLPGIDPGSTEYIAPDSQYYHGSPAAKNVTGNQILYFTFPQVPRARAIIKHTP